MERYARLFYELRQADCSGLGMWLHDQLRYQESPYARLVERGGEDPALEEAARRDVETFTLLSELDCDAVLREIGTRRPGNFPACWPICPGGAEDAPLPFRGLRRFIRPTGRAFSPLPRLSMGGWGSAAGGAARLPGPGEMIGYELQRDQVVANTRAMLEGNLVNNVLLYGDSGTGKSATVKSLLSLPGFEDLRLIEVQKEELADAGTDPYPGGAAAEVYPVYRRSGL